MYDTFLLVDTCCFIMYLFIFNRAKLNQHLNGAHITLSSIKPHFVEMISNMNCEQLKLII